jgi:hypothetical protein
MDQRIPGGRLVASFRRRVSQAARSIWAQALWLWNFQLFADGPNRSFFDFAMGGTLAILCKVGLNQML